MNSNFWIMRQAKGFRNFCLHLCLLLQSFMLSSTAIEPGPHACRLKYVVEKVSLLPGLQGVCLF